MPYQYLNCAEYRSQRAIHKKDFNYKATGLTLKEKEALLHSFLILLNYKQIELARWAPNEDTAVEDGGTNAQEEHSKLNDKKLNAILDILLDYIEHQFEMQLLLENPYKWIGEGKKYPRSPLRQSASEWTNWRIQAKWEENKEINRYRYANYGQIYGIFHSSSMTISMNECLQKMEQVVEFLESLIHGICHAIVFWYHREEYDIRCSRQKCIRDRKHHYLHCTHGMHWLWWRRFANACKHIFGLHIDDKLNTVENDWAREFIKKHNKPFGPQTFNYNLLGAIQFVHPPPNSIQISNANINKNECNYINILYLYNVQWQRHQIYTVHIGGMRAKNCNVAYVKRCFEAQHGIIASSITLFQGARFNFTNVQIFADHQSLDHFGLREKHKINFAENSFFS